MPYSFETNKIPLPEGKDRRVKLTESDKQQIRDLTAEGYSQRKLAAMFGVSRRLITFVQDPKKLEANKQVRKERGGSKLYYSREKHTQAVREHRKYKKSVISNL